ncbi:uncharacterized protein LOC115746919 [Rhodamnia argentea]|uniref:Uncharacterized protein LOC115746919 n=1 Tax=Rhodamnia argentea TaxID=178133 RepID=A0A8B8PVF8_9MYRT|nr:uncharacterized protein LOC115746919 [Rhodamnia argentea]XP_048138067.1 uncharacterized protein LOC115746919 [Rhodamnia argentea]XP_048138068.1 uncharacterized protein LOC115746919 [Rhodamnia argentea]
MLKRGSRSKQLFGIHSFRIPALVSSVTLILLVLILFSRDGDKKPMPVPAHLKQRWNRFDSLVQFRPVVEFRNGTDLISQIPDSPKAVLFIAHGCNGRAINFWDRSPTCQQCVGLPEERLLVLEGLSRKFAVLTVSSMGRCWTMGEERVIVRDIIRWWIGKNKLEKLPLVALGASSGGYFVSALATNLRFSSIVLMIAEGMFDQMDVPEDYPPTLFVHMPKDTYRQQKIDEFMPVLKSKGIDVAAVECVEFPLSVSTFAERIPGVEENVSAKLFELFRSKGFVDANGYMKSDGRKTRWKKALQENKNVLLDRQLVNHVQEELNLAFAYHEMTSLQSEEIFKWFESHMS